MSSRNTVPFYPQGVTVCDEACKVWPGAITLYFKIKVLKIKLVQSKTSICDGL